MEESQAFREAAAFLARIVVEEEERTATCKSFAARLELERGATGKRAHYLRRFLRRIEGMGSEPEKN